MKKFLSILLGITLAVSSSVAFASDSTTTVLVTKAGDTSAKVCEGSKCLGTVPVKFADGSDWSSVKDSYDISTAEASALGSKGACITVHGDGGISVSKKVCSTSKKK